ncbi:MAG: hypothetical protein IPM35_26645 [Myxococcales bacterium]|nr:hypothetical protein [Myxococcales bacterium]
MLLHFLAVAVPGCAPLSDPRVAWPTWFALRRAFPEVWAACLTSDRIHLLAELPSPFRARRRLAHVLGVASRRFGLKRCWRPVKAPESIAFPNQLGRYVRDIHLAPCFDGRARDPLAWPWSTYRGMLGAELDPWVSGAKLAHELRWHHDGFLEGFHEFSSTDLHLNPHGSPLPVPESPRDIARVPLAKVLRAALSATPWSNAPTRRRLAVQLAHEQGWTARAALCRALGSSERSLRRLARGGDPLWTRPAALCLGDERLLFEPEVAHALDAFADAPEGASEPACRARARRPTCPESSSSASAPSSTAGVIRSRAWSATRCA